MATMVTSTPVSIGAQIHFLDDGPSVTTNLITNGSFEIGNGLGDGQWSIYHSIPGWSSVTGPNGNVPFEIEKGNVGGLAAEDGTAKVELDSDLDASHGNLPVDANHSNDTGHTNATIAQSVAGTVAGQTYELTFWYSPRGDEGDANSGSMDVLWNGVVVKSIDSTGMAADSWQKFTVIVTGTGAGDTVAFSGTGQENSLGAFLDNVSLTAAAVVDEDGLKVSNGDAVTGNHDSQPGDLVVPNNDNAPAAGGDSNEATATGLLNINWGADNFDAPDQYSARYRLYAGCGVGRSLTFTNANVAVAGEAGTALTSHGDLVTFSVVPSSNGTELIGTATHGNVTRTVIEITLSDDGNWRLPRRPEGRAGPRAGQQREQYRPDVQLHRDRFRRRHCAGNVRRGGQRRCAGTDGERGHRKRQ